MENVPVCLFQPSLNSICSWTHYYLCPKLPSGEDGFESAALGVSFSIDDVIDGYGTNIRLRKSAVEMVLTCHTTENNFFKSPPWEEVIGKIQFCYLRGGGENGANHQTWFSQNRLPSRTEAVWRTNRGGTTLSLIQLCAPHLSQGPDWPYAQASVAVAMAMDSIFLHVDARGDVGRS